MRSRTSRSSRLALVASIAAVMAMIALAPGRWSAAQEPNDLVGDYAVSIGSNDVPKDLASGSILVGRWHVAFLADGSYYAERLDIGRVVSGSYEVDGDTLTVTDEEGLISCSNATAATGDQVDIATGTYSVEVDVDLLAMTVAEDGCRTRAVLFGTRDFGEFVACLTNAVPTEASPVAEATPTDDDDELDQPEASGQQSDGGLFDLLTPAAGQTDDSDDEDRDDESADDENDDEDEGDDEEIDVDVDQEIDDLLAQMTSCWQTQDADQFLPLLTEDFQEIFLGSGTEEEQKAEIEELMIQPLVWERAGEIDLDGDDEATVLVSLSIAGAESFETYRFVRGDDGWLWDGSEG